MIRLFVRIKTPVIPTEDGFETTVDYLVRDTQGAVSAAGQTDARGLAEVVENLAPWADDPANVVVLVPVGDVLSTSCTVPGRNVAQMRRAVPYAVEEFVTADIETMQVACATPVRNEPVRCLVAPREAMDLWLGFLASVGIQPGFLTADAMALADDELVTSVAFDNGVALVRSGAQMAAIDTPNLASVVDSVLPAAGDDGASVIRLINGAASALHGADLDGVEVEELPIGTSLLAFLAEEFDAGAVNLLQGDYAVKRRPTGAWARFRPAAIAAGVWFVLGLGVVAAEGFWADHKASVLRAEATNLYRTLYGVDRVAGNPATRMRRLLGESGTAGTTFHGLIGKLGTGLDDIDGYYELRGLTYSPRRGLDADLTVRDDAVLESLGASLRRSGLDMEVISTDSAQSGGRISARLRVLETLE